MDPHIETYKDLLLFLATAGIMVPLFARLKMSPVLGFLTAGVILGPFGIGAFVRDVPWLRFFSLNDMGQIERFAEFGVAFLLFMIGLELSWDRLVRMRRLVFGLGSAQVVLTTVVLAGIAFLLGQSPASAIVIGAALALSSTALIVPALAERKRLNSAAGRSILAVLLFQDLAVAPLLFMVGLLGQRVGGDVVTGLLYSLLPSVLALAGVIVFGRLMLRPLFLLAAGTRNSELFMACCLLVVVGTGLLMAAAGQSMALGAFVAGLLLAETEYRRQVEVTIQPFQGLLLGLLFVSIGARLDLSEVLANPLPTIGVALGLIAIKILIVLPLARAFGLTSRVAQETALVIGPAGEFALVVLGIAIAERVVPASAAAVATIAATLSMFAVPLLVRLAESISERRAAADPGLEALAPEPHEGPPRTIIVGHGRVGSMVGGMLARHDIPYVAIDSDPALVAAQRNEGQKVYYGDATRPELLERCGIANALALVVTMDEPKAVEAVVVAGRAKREDLVIVARARDAAHAAKLYGLKATDAVPETIEASLQLSEAVLIDVGIPMGEVIASIHERRDELRRELQGSASAAIKREDSRTQDV